ncbi:MAG TPA: ABC transporter substrate-binding protein [Trebonia sp.]|jgi:NitT/TauT family transport system substrate-binding protein|nr:ABC transporter substrate-binding protein [Trebonia sp.]
MFRISRLAYCAIAMVSAAGLGGCANGTGNQATAGAPEQSNIVVDSVPAAEEGGLYVAQASGFFKQQGLNVTIDPITGGEAGIPNLQSGRAQLIGGNYVSFVLAQMAGQFNGKPASFSIVAAGSQILAGTEALYVLPGSRFKTVADLAAAHATVGLNTPHDVGQVLLGALLAQYGYPISSVRQVTPSNGFPALMTMLKSGTVDAAWLPQPFATIAQQEYGATELADFDQGPLEEFPFTGYIGMSSWAKSHPNTVAAFDRALEQGQQLADSDAIAVQQAFEKYVGLPPIIATTMPYDTYPLSVSAAQIQRVSNAMYEFGLEPGRATAYPLARMIDQTAAASGA